MQKRQYHKEMQEALGQMGRGERLALHSCCGPCSSAVLELLASRLSVTLVYYNPNIWPEQEYLRRRDEQLALLKKLPVEYPVEFVEQAYDHGEFLAAARGLEAQPEGGARCAECFALRLRQTARIAQQRGIMWLGTTLSISPHKDAPLLNQLGEQAAAEHGLRFLAADFKKQDGYKRSLELSRMYGMYRQAYCGCEFSYNKKEAGL